MNNPKRHGTARRRLWVSGTCALFIGGAFGLPRAAAEPHSAEPHSSDVERIAAAAALVVASDAQAGGPAGAACPGDCDGDGSVRIDEIVRSVNIATGAQAVAACRAIDANGDGLVTIDELIGAVRSSLEGCGGGPGESLCGGPLTSTPKLCDLRVTPERVRVGSSITVSFGISDLEGDLETLCVALGPVGGTPMEQCETFTPGGEDMTVNLLLDLPPITVGLAPGRYTIAMAIRDRAGNVSNLVSFTFEVFRLRV